MQLNNLHKNWLETRRIRESVQDDFGLYTNDENLIVIPVCDANGEFIFNKYRQDPSVDKEPKYLYDKGGKMTLYGWHKAKAHKTILVVEGEFDCLVAWSHNIPAVTSTGGALSFPDEWVEMLKGKEVILCFDNDKAGGEGMAKVANRLGLENVKIMFLPDRAGVNDLSDYVSSGGDLKNLMKSAEVIDDVEEDKGIREGMWKSVFFHEAWLKAQQKPVYTKAVVNKDLEDKKERAKQYPMYELLDFKQNKCCCPFHNEKVGSFHYYPKSNTAYCFGGCGRAYDVIDIYREIHKCGFKEAIKELNKLL